VDNDKKRLRLPDVWREARDLVWVYRYRLAVGMALMLVSRLAGLVLPASSKYLIDEVVGKGRAELLVWVAAAAGVATFVQAVSGFLLSQVLGVAAQRAITEMRKTIQEHVERLPIQYFDSTQTGQLISRIMSDAEGIRNLVGTGLVNLTGGLVTASIAIVVLVYLNWRLTAITLVVLGVFGGGMAFAFKRLRPMFRERGKIYADVTGRLGESLGGVRIVKAYAAERREALVFARGAHRLFRNTARTMTAVSSVSSLTSIIVGAIGVTMIVVGGNSILSGAMTLGDMFMYVFFTGLVAAPLVEIAAIGTQITEAFAGLDRIREVRGMATEDADDASREAVARVGGDVEFDDVSFEYEEGVPVLEHVSFSAPSGSTTALVGSSGSGKTTLIGLVMAFHRPNSGVVRVDGRDLTTTRLRDYRRFIGVVLQDNFLFDGTIADNIAFSRPNATRDDVVAAGRVAHCDEFVSGFKDGYDTIVGERGVKLSGGQRQRVAIARAIIADPRILILDEATSSLDSESEEMIQDGLRSLRQGRTTFVIAHRLSTIRSADQILVLEAGTIVERGTHGDLLAAEGRYRQLYDKQYRFEQNQFVNPGEDFAVEKQREAVRVTPPSTL
jgi:ABC-type multidrug transport system fused ATPase/permease subunit